jgi:tRNA dimethylallyltransferase
MKKTSKKLIVVLGPTATGKTKLAVFLASKFNGEIISADSRQVFRGMDIGTGKDLTDYVVNQDKKKITIPYHLIDVVSPKTEFNVAKYQRLAYLAIEDILSRGKVPILVGGTGLYLDAVIYGYDFASQSSKKELIEIRKKLAKLNLKQLLKKLEKVDPETFKVIDQDNRRRVQRALEIYYQTGQRKSELSSRKKTDYESLILGIKFPLEEIYQKIGRRLKERIDEGMIEEVKKLHDRGVSWQRLDGFGLEYRYVSRYLRGIITKVEMLEQLEREIRRFSKRQLTWFKRNNDINWLIGDNLKEKMAQAEKMVKKFIN